MYSLLVMAWQVMMVRRCTCYHTMVHLSLLKKQQLAKDCEAACRSAWKNGNINCFIKTITFRCCFFITYHYLGGLTFFINSITLPSLLLSLVSSPVFLLFLA